MGFLSGIFKKKKGGTMFGNLLRGVANKATGGVLGNGAELAAWEAKEAEKEQKAAIEAGVQAALKNNPAYMQGQQFGQPLATGASNLASKVGLDLSIEPKMFSADWFKKYALMLVMGAAIIGLVIYLIVSNRKPKKVRR